MDEKMASEEENKDVRALFFLCFTLTHALLIIIIGLFCLLKYYKRKHTKLFAFNVIMYLY